MTFADDVLEQLQPMLYGQATIDLDHYVRAISDELFEVIEVIASDDGEAIGWSIILDIDRAPDVALPWLGQFVGAEQITGLTPDEQRERIRDTEGWKRGTVAALIGAAQTHLTGERTVRVIERDGSAYRITVITYYSQTPDAVAVEWGEPLNRMENPSFETDIIGAFNVANFSLARITTGAYVGTAALELTAIANGIATARFANRNDTGAPVTASVGFTFSMYAKGAHRQARITVIFFNNSGVQVGSEVVGPVIVVSDTYQRYSVFGTVPVSATNAQVYFKVVDATTLAGEKFVIDGVQFERGSISDYFDGSMGDHRWQGVAHQSRSESAAAWGSQTVYNDILSQKAAGLVLNHEVRKGQIWQDVVETYATWQDVLNRYQTWQGVINDQPGS